MRKTTAPRARQINLYTVESDGLPVAQAMAISQAEAVRLYVESVQQPTMSARLSTPLEARTLAGLPLLQREPAVIDTKTADLFDDVPNAPVSPVVGAVVDAEWDPVASIPHMEAVIEAMEHLSADHVEDLRAMAPEVADAQPGEPADCLDAAPPDWAEEDISACGRALSGDYFTVINRAIDVEGSAFNADGIFGDPMTMAGAIIFRAASYVHQIGAIYSDDEDEAAAVDGAPAIELYELDKRMCRMPARNFSTMEAA